MKTPPTNNRWARGFGIAAIIVFIVLLLLCIVVYLYGITHLHANLF